MLSRKVSRAKLIGVEPHVRGRGVEGMLPHALFAEAARRGVGLCLNVRHDNPARRLSERFPPRAGVWRAPRPIYRA
ncbi:MAG TPA: hypothetical protein VHT21_01525 [Stellaceae bacterium]|nr:hypothetical protein [Stellaceae bacterium]